MPDRPVHRTRCVGPGMVADAEKCLASKDAAGWLALGWHDTPGTGDTAAYNGVIAWRCHACFTEHRRRVRQHNK